MEWGLGVWEWQNRGLDPLEWKWVFLFLSKVKRVPSKKEVMSESDSQSGGWQFELSILLGWESPANHLEVDLMGEAAVLHKGFEGFAK